MRAARTGTAWRTIVIGALALAGCDRVPRVAPPRANDPISIPPLSTIIAVPVGADLDKLALALTREIPKELWSIDQADQVCVPSRQVKILFAKVKTPTLRCRIVARVTHGALAISGAGQDIVVTIPVHATVSAKDVGGILKQETAQADAKVRAHVRLDLTADWTPRASANLAYEWVDPPHVDFLGQRIDLTKAADAKLKGVVAKLERTLPSELAKLNLRETIARAWASAFTSLQLNDGDPPVWMRITPHALGYGGYDIQRNRLTLKLGMTAQTETYVGPRPADPAPTPLPPLNRVAGQATDILFTIPVIADYRELEPVLAKALARRAQRPFDIPGIGPVIARFGTVTIYGTTGGKIAVGLTFDATRPGKSPAHGTIWLTARPTNAANSRRVGFADLVVAGVTDSTGTSLLIKLANTPGLSATIAAALEQDFGKDYDQLLAKIAHVIADRRQGDLRIRARISDIRTGTIVAAGQGLYLPVSGKGTASIELSPR